MRQGRLPPGLRIRPETGDDPEQVLEVVSAAFGSPVQARLVEAIRNSPEFVAELCLVAEMAGRVVGHVMISQAVIDDGRARRRIALLSPLAVAPQAQGLGVGSELVRRVTALAEARGEPVVVLEGSPAFYGRLGFEHSVPLGIHIALPSWAPPEAAQVLRLSGYTGSIRGRVLYPPAFDEVAEG